MNSFKACVESLLKFNNDLDNLIPLSQSANWRRRGKCYKDSKILNKNSNEILNALSKKFKNLRNLRKNTKLC